MTRSEWAFTVVVGLSLAPATALLVAVVGARRWKRRVHWALAEQ